MKTFDFTVSRPDDMARLDHWLAAQGLPLSRRKIRSVIDAGGVYINGKRVRIASRAVRSGDKVRVAYHEEALRKIKSVKIELTDKDILFDQHDVIAINKPPGLPAQATLDQSVQHVIPALKAWSASHGRKNRAYVLVHRLDKETSGLLLVADGNTAATWLTDQFRDRTVRKTYWAVVHGIPAWTRFTERAFLSPIDRKTGDVKVVRSGGRQAVTHFRCLAANKKLGISLIECSPETGRSHQIRVHLAINDLPIVGDKRYGRSGASKLPPELAALTAWHHFLHARALEFAPAPGRPRVRLEAEPPEKFAEFCKVAGLAANQS